MTESIAQRFAAEQHLKAGRAYEAALVMAMPAALYAGYDEIMRLAFIMGAATALNAKKEANQMPNIMITNETGHPKDTVVILPDGEAVHGLTQVDISIGVDKMATAVLTILKAKFLMNAEAILSVETLEVSAAFHGYRLVPIAEDE